MNSAEPVLVVDFGTSTSSAALVAEEQVRLIKEPGTGSWSWPSAVCLSGDTLLVGTPAERMKRAEPSNYRSEFKRDLADATSIPLGEKSYHPRDLVIELLTALHGPAERLLGGTVDRLILTIPASYPPTDPRRDLMMDAGERAGFTEVELLPEPVAAALAPVEGNEFGEDDLVMVYDFGGGTFDAAIVRFRPGGYDVLGHAALDDCGGRDIDELLSRHMVGLGGDRLRNLLDAGAGDSGDLDTAMAASRVRMELNDLVRQAKHQLTDAPTASDYFTPTSLPIVIERSELITLVAPLLQRTVDCCHALIAGCRLNPGDLTAMLLVGGSSRMPIVADTLHHEYKRPVRFAEDPGVAVVQGGARWSQRPNRHPFAPWPRENGEEAIRWKLPVDSARLIRWLCEPSHNFTPGQPLLLVRTADGELLRLTAGDADGVLLDRHLAPGATIASGQWLATIRPLPAPQPPPTSTSPTPTPNSMTREPGSTTGQAPPISPSDTPLPKSPPLPRTGPTGAASRPSQDGGVSDHLSAPRPTQRRTPQRLRSPSEGPESGPVELARLNHGKAVRAVAFSPDGTRLATGGADGTARVWEPISFKELVRLAHRNCVEAVAFSPDGDRLATGSRDDTAKLWDLATGQELARMSHKAGVYAVAFSPEGTQLATGCADGTARVWNLATGLELLRVGNPRWLSPVVAVTFNPDGTWLATGSGAGTVDIWNLVSGKRLARLKCSNSLNSVASSPDGNRLATASKDKYVQVWNPNTRHELTRLNHDNSVNAVAFSPDGNRLATGSKDNYARVWDPETSRELERLSHDNSVNAVAFSPDGNRLATGSSDMTARLWALSPYQRVMR